MKTFTRITVAATIIIVIISFASADPKSSDNPATASAYLTNGAKQELFVANLVAIETTRHRRFYWAMTFERVADQARFHYQVIDSDPVASALGFKEWKHGQEGVEARIKAAPRVVLLTVPYTGRDYPEAPKYVVQGCFVIDESVPNQRTMNPF